MPVPEEVIAEMGERIPVELHGRSMYREVRGSFNLGYNSKA
jgi:hypothetical protein